MQSYFFTLLTLSLPLISFAAPLNHNSTIVARAGKCSTTAPGRANAPCICDGILGLRLGDVRPRCTQNAQAVVFKNPTSTTDFSVTLSKTFATGDVQCDHIVELQFIANQINNGDAAICTALVDTATKLPKPAYEAFFQKINSVDNLIFADSGINGAKGVIVGGGNFGPSKTKKIATGVLNYLNLMESRTVAPSMKFAQQISDSLDTIVPAGTGFNSFQALWDASVSSFTKNLVDCQIPNLKRRSSMSFWRRFLAIDSRALSCPLPPKAVASSAKPTATAKPVATKPAVTAKPPAATKPVVAPVKPVAPAKPVVAPAKPVVAPVKPVVAPAKPVVAPVKPVVAPKPVAKPVLPVAKPIAKPVAKPVLPVAKPIAKPIAKPVAKPVAPKKATKPRAMPSRQ